MTHWILPTACAILHEQIMLIYIGNRLLELLETIIKCLFRISSLRKQIINWCGWCDQLISYRSLRKIFTLNIVIQILWHGKQEIRSICTAKWNAELHLGMKISSLYLSKDFQDVSETSQTSRRVIGFEHALLFVELYGIRSGILIRIVSGVKASRARYKFRRFEAKIARYIFLLASLSKRWKRIHRLKFASDTNFFVERMVRRSGDFSAIFFRQSAPFPATRRFQFALKRDHTERIAAKDCFDGKKDSQGFDGHWQCSRILESRGFLAFRFLMKIYNWNKNYEQRSLS